MTGTTAGGFRRSLSAGLQWWISELATFFPTRLRQRLQSSQAQQILRWTNGNLQDAGGRNASAGILALGPDHYVRQTAVLPLAAEKTLADVVRYELDRLTPFSEQDVYFACRVRERMADLKKLSVEIFLIPRPALKAILGECADKGIQITRVDVLGGDDLQAQGLSLYQAGRRLGRQPLGQKLWPWCLGLAVCGTLFWAGAHLQGKASQLEAAQKQLTGLRAEVASLSHLKGPEPSGAASTALRLQNQRPSRVEVLEEITARLPDDSWLTGLRLMEDRATLTGMAQNAAALITVFDASPLFTAPEFSDPIVQDPKSGWERFSLQLRIADRPQS